MPVLVSGARRQWWVRLDRDVYYRTRADAIAERNGVPGIGLGKHG
jgi:hypothetical protein